jgi:plastocyanin
MIMTVRSRWAVSLAFVAMLALVATACGGDDEGGESTEVVDLRGQATVEVVMTDNVFTPENIRIDPGTKVVWVNQGDAGHQMDAFNLDGFGVGFDSDVIRGDDTYEFTFDNPGTYRYYCALHGSNVEGMIGAIVVGDGPLDGVATPTLPDDAAENTLRVPQDHATIQAAVDASTPGDLILVDKGVYNEAVEINPPHENIVIRGVDRNETILDGEFEEDKPNGIKVLADGVAIENLTARNYTTNAFFWTGVDGYRGSYLNSYRTGDYGVYAFDSVNGQFDNTYASGSADAGFYIGQCYPCNAVIRDSVSEWNGLGYSGTNAGGNLLIVNSVWRYNRAGIVPNSGTGEALWPEKETTVVGNLVYGNSNAATPSIDIAETAIGNGILLAGGTKNVVERNRVWDHDISGIGTIPLPEKVLDPSNENAVDFDALDNRVVGNVLEDNRIADLLNVKNITEPGDAGGNCFSDNEFTTSLPADIEALIPCDATGSGTYEAPIGIFVEKFTEPKPDGADYKTAAIPEMPLGENMPDPLNAPAVPASNGAVPPSVDLAAIVVPAKP